jgi:hypothetical protein
MLDDCVNAIFQRSVDESPGIDAETHRATELPHHGGDQLVARLEVMLQSAARQAGAVGNEVGGGSRIAALGDQVDGGPDQGIARSRAALLLSLAARSPSLESGRPLRVAGTNHCNH